MPLAFGLTIGVIELFELRDGSGEFFFILFCFLFPSVAGYKTAKLMSNYDTEVLSNKAMGKVQQLKRFVYGYIICFFINVFFLSKGLLDNLGNEGVLILGIPAVASLIITFLVPLLNDLVKKVLKSKPSDKSTERVEAVPEERKKSKMITGKWVLDKIVAPVISGSILGLITYLITGNFQTGETVSLISISISWVMNR